MFWFDYDKMSKLISIASALSNDLQAQINDLFKAKTNFELTFTKSDIYLINNTNQEVYFINILHDVCYKHIDIDSKINSAINDDLFYEERKIINNTGSFAITELVILGGETFVRKMPKAQYTSLDEEYRFMSELYLENNDYFVKTIKDDNSESYLMELANESLMSYINNRGNIQDEIKMLIVNSIIDALDFLHKRGIIHNDLHPENILLFKGDNFEKWKISDFGLAYIISNRTFVIKEVKQQSRKTEYVNCRSNACTIQNDLYSMGKLINFIYTKNPRSTNHPFYNISKKCISKGYIDILEVKKEFNFIAEQLISNV